MLTVPTFLAAAGIGAAAGLHTAIWGMYKDAPHEGFTWRQFVRSIVISTLAGPLLAAGTGIRPTTAGSLVLLFGLVYATERAISETYKTFFRQQDQSKYTIPMQLAVFGRPVLSPVVRALVGIGYAGAIVGGVYLVAWLQQTFAPLPRLVTALTVGALGGWYSAFGGAWKDAPIEGFQVFKFFRSPVLAAGFAWLLLGLTASWPEVMFGAIGFTVAATETYKTFFFPSKPRGKFAGRPVTFPDMLVRRYWAVPVYVMIWLGVIGGAWISATRPPVSGRLVDLQAPAISPPGAARRPPR